jgi:quercetin dioxygenase-like cupin family protein
MFAKLLVAFFALVVTGTIIAQQPAATPAPAIKRTLLQKVEVPGSTYEANLAVYEITAGMNGGRHTHPGPETGTLVEGEMLLMIEGQPDRTVKAGDSYQIPVGIVHDVRAVGGPAKGVAIYIVPKGMPLATPAK